MSIKWRGNGDEEDRNCDGDCITSHLERVGGKWETIDTCKELEIADRERSKRKVRETKRQ